MRGRPVRLARGLIPVLVAAACTSAAPGAAPAVAPAALPSRAPVPADRIASLDLPEPRYVEGTLTVAPDGEVRLCNDFRIGQPGMIADCTDRGLQVLGADLAAVPRLAEQPSGGKVAYPPVLLRGRVGGGRLQVTDMPVVYSARVEARLDPPVPDMVASAYVDQQPQPAAFSPPQQVLLVREVRPQDSAPVTVTVGAPPATVPGSAGGFLTTEVPPCPANASCRGGALLLGTAHAQPGSYDLTQPVTTSRGESTLHVVLVVSPWPGPTAG